MPGAHYADPIGQHHLSTQVLGSVDDINNFISNLLNPEYIVRQLIEQL